MKTSMVESWTGNPADMGPLYPFVGNEVPFFLLCVLFWIVYTLWQMKFERRTYEGEERDLAEGDHLSRIIESNQEHP